MSLEGMMRKAKRGIKKRDADLAAKGTTAKEEQIKKNEAIEARNSSGVLSAAQQEAAKAAEAKKFPEPGEGVFCGAPGCGLTITGTLNDLVAHRATHA